jgi:hypothetical protein
MANQLMTAPHMPTHIISPPRVMLKVVSQGFRYCDYGAGLSLSRSIRLGARPLQFVVNTWCDESLTDKEIEIGVEIRDRDSDDIYFETFWVSTIAHVRQQSSFIFREFPEELRQLRPGSSYTYHANALVNETDDYAQRDTRVVAK